MGAVRFSGIHHHVSRTESRQNHRPYCATGLFFHTNPKPSLKGNGRFLAFCKTDGALKMALSITIYFYFNLLRTAIYRRTYSSLIQHTDIYSYLYLIPFRRLAFVLTHVKCDHILIQQVISYLSVFTFTSRAASSSFLHFAICKTLFHAKAALAASMEASKGRALVS